MPTGRSFHRIINPRRDMPAEAAKIHGHTNETLADKPSFADIVDEFLAFIGEDAKLVAHNAMFDFKFVNAELALAGRNKLSVDRIVDTLVIARDKFPGKGHSLDALCGRFGIDLSRREKHGALLDSELLADVYVELRGGRQRGMSLDTPTLSPPALVAAANARRVWPVRTFAPSDEERARHRAFVDTLTNPMWKRVPGYQT